ncbi:HNH endonuclease [Streptomyces vinaceus]|uniref:HNH endonuclease n=1 Tax=Streptomyces vinaceus TaxID=1960 RepID=UPI003800C3F2
MARKKHNQDGARLTSSGYRLVRRPEAVGKQLWVLEHRLVMEWQLGRPLRSDESVHHRNGDKTDNRVENLELWVRSQPTGQRVDELLAWAHELIARYES